MEDIIGPIITGCFTLGGILLADYLARRRKRTRAELGAAAQAVLEQAPDSAPAAEPTTPPLPTAEPRAFVFYKERVWWVLLALICVLSICGALFASWFLRYVLSIFNVQLPTADMAWVALIVAGLGWGIAYGVAGGLKAEESADTLFPLLGAYEYIFSGDGFSEFAVGLLSALPINVLVSWGLATGVSVAAARYLGADFGQVVYLVFGVVTVLQIAWFSADQASS